MSSHTAVAAHSFGGGFDLGVVQAGFEIQAKMSRDVGFGVYNTLANRHLLGERWDSVAQDPGLWPRHEGVDLVYGNPPCSGFSVLSNAAFRGEDSSINDYMWELVGYAGRVAPTMVAWESVQTTFRQGLKLMRRLRDDLEEKSGHPYHLTHVLHNNYSHGGVSQRKRYFWVASRVPFGVGLGRAEPDGSYHELGRLPRFRDMLSDLPLGLTMAPQVYRGVQGNRVLTDAWWSQREAHDGTGVVDGHDVYHPRNNLDRVRETLEHGADWHQGEDLGQALKRMWQERGDLGVAWQYTTRSGKTKQQQLVDTDFNTGYSAPKRWHADRPANVITGSAVHSVVHPWLPRLITFREAARIQGFPDAWKIWPVRNAPDLGPGWGKGVPVQAARWLGHWLSESLDGRPGPLQGVDLQTYRKDLHRLYGSADRETVVDTTWAWRAS